MVVAGPGIPAGAQLPHLGTQVDLAPTWLALAGIETPPTFDGRSVLSFLIPNASHSDLKPATRELLLRQRGGSDAPPLEARVPSAFRTETFHQYYSAGNCWAPADGGDQCPICGNGTAQENSRSGSASNGLCVHGVCPREPSSSGTTRCLCGPSNTYIGVHVLGDAALPGRWKYGEFQTHCSSEQLETRSCFDEPDTVELFDLVADPWERWNVASLANYSQAKAALHARLHAWYGCAGASCKTDDVSTSAARKSDDEQWTFVGGDWATASGSGGAFTAPLNEASNNFAILASARYTGFDATFDWRFSPDNPCGCLLPSRVA